MNQASGADEATSGMLKKAVVAATVGTEHEGKFNADYVVTSARRRHPEVFAPAKSLLISVLFLISRDLLVSVVT